MVHPQLMAQMIKSSSWVMILISSCDLESMQPHRDRFVWLFWSLSWWIILIGSFNQLFWLVIVINCLNCLDGLYWSIIVISYHDCSLQLIIMINHLDWMLSYKHPFSWTSGSVAFMSSIAIKLLDHLYAEDHWDRTCPYLADVIIIAVWWDNHFYVTCDGYPDYVSMIGCWTHLSTLV